MQIYQSEKQTPITKVKQIQNEFILIESKEESRQFEVNTTKY